MALGEKLGKVFGAVGAGLSFIPGPWSAVGIGLSAAGGIASMVDKKKDKPQEEPESPASTPTEPPDTSRPPQEQLATNTEGYVSQQPTISSPPRFSSEGHYQDRMQDEIASMIISDVPRGPYG
jgi:hypothetical protein